MIFITLRKIRYHILRGDTLFLLSKLLPFMLPFSSEFVVDSSSYETILTGFADIFCLRVTTVCLISRIKSSSVGLPKSPHILSKRGGFRSHLSGDEADA